MSLINTPENIGAAPVVSQPLLAAVQKSIGSVPNMFRIIANSPATRERIALAVAQANDCDYCLAAHSYLGQHMAKLTSHEIAANRRGGSTDAKADAAVRLAYDITINRGEIDPALMKVVQAAGYSDAEIVEIITHVALNTLTNYINKVLATEVDFPAATELAA
ncbi:carboxymuconolactone decarboxylase family protein [Kordiimonas aestuarii]|uniref:carboxymuconolactone decarboxylase family protein n=1 Tax=Kordiimonas aestuarii TaxID=1005925 RepID=UPI0021CE612C|nr:carboxymuconolactone decarboxylase family protein [Kordiimonas aestuarii]